jgi:hypothetical protein
MLGSECPFVDGKPSGDLSRLWTRRTPGQNVVAASASLTYFNILVGRQTVQTNRLGVVSSTSNHSTAQAA